jgi:hypothetical protein
VHLSGVILGKVKPIETSRQGQIRITPSTWTSIRTCDKSDLPDSRRVKAPGRRDDSIIS